MLFQSDNIQSFHRNQSIDLSLCDNTDSHFTFDCVSESFRDEEMKREKERKKRTEFTCSKMTKRTSHNHEARAFVNNQIDYHLNRIVLIFSYLFCRFDLVHFPEKQII